MSVPNKGFRHIRNITAGSPTTKGGVTMAFDSPKHVNDLTENDRVRIGMSFCSINDVFCRETGRDASSHRMGNDATAVIVDGKTFLDFLRTPDIEGLQVEVAVTSGLGNGVKTQLYRLLNNCK